LKSSSSPAATSSCPRPWPASTSPPSSPTPATCGPGASTPTASWARATPAALPASTLMWMATTAPPPPRPWPRPSGSRPVRIPT